MTYMWNNAEVHEIKEHIHAESVTYPADIRTPVQLTAGAANVYGAWVQIIAGGTLPGQWDIHYVTFENISANDTYRIQFSYGGSNTTMGETPNLVRSAAFTDFIGISVTTGDINHVIPSAADALYARLKSAGGGNNGYVSVCLHPYL
jgi:hypothetical protein